MSQKNIKNIAVSTRQKLLNKARKDQRPFAELLQYFTMERFLYRLSQSKIQRQVYSEGCACATRVECPNSKTVTSQ